MFVVLLLVAMFAYTGLWPPLVVVESNSMMHGDDNTSHVGAIDTGDLVLVKKVTKPSDIATYADGLSNGHKTYGDYGDVVVYKKFGSDVGTPIIHRAMIYLEANADGQSYRSESLRDAPPSAWSLTVENDTWDHITGRIILNDVGYTHLPIGIDVGSILTRAEFGGTAPVNVFVTKGDHNTDTDLTYWGPVEFGWVVGKARGEIPWFGLLKLWSTDSLGAAAPPNSVRDLWISIILIVVTPIAVDLALTIRDKRSERRRKTFSAREWTEEKEPTIPGEKSEKG